MLETDPATFSPSRPRIPLWVKAAYTLFVLTLVPVYWVAYGPTNFLYFCDVALLMTVPALWLENALLASAPQRLAAVAAAEAVRAERGDPARYPARRHRCQARPHRDGHCPRPRLRLQRCCRLRPRGLRALRRQDDPCHRRWQDGRANAQAPAAARAAADLGHQPQPGKSGGSGARLRRTARALGATRRCPGQCRH